MKGNCNVVFSVLLGCETNMTSTLSRDFIAKEKFKVEKIGLFAPFALPQENQNQNLFLQ